MINQEYMKLYVDEIIEIGKKKLFNDCTYFGMISTDLSYEEFVSKSIMDVPDWISKRDFIQLFSKEFKEQYEQLQERKL